MATSVGLMVSDRARDEAEGPLFRIRYDGGDADKNVIDMRQLGESLQGIDRIISDGLIAVFNNRVPKKGERAPLILKAQEPVPGSFEITGYLQDLSPLLLLGVPLIAACGQDIVVDWMKSVIHYFAGRKEEAEGSLQAISDLTTKHLLARDRSEERTHELQMAQVGVLREAMQRLGSASAQAAAPVGRSVRRLDFSAPGRTGLEIDEPTADILREQEDVDWTDLQTVTLRTDGFTFHTGKLSVEHPERSGFILADVTDPVFKEESNVYARAAQRKALIRVQAKLGYRSGRLEKFSSLILEARLTTLREAREQGKLDQFIAEREAEQTTPGDPGAFNHALASMAGTSKEAPGASKPRPNDG